MAPNQSWRFISGIASKVRAQHKPARDKRNMKLTEELLALGVELMEQAGAMMGWQAAITFRDGLIIALLSLVPLRRRNLEGLLIGKI